MSTVFYDFLQEIVLSYVIQSDMWGNDRKTIEVVLNEIPNPPAMLGRIEYVGDGEDNN